MDSICRKKVWFVASLLGCLVGMMAYTGPAVAAGFDSDNDGLDDELEDQFSSNPWGADTDGDGYTDYTEVMYGYSPADPSPQAKLPRKIVIDRTNQQLSLLVRGVTVMKVPVSTGVSGKDTPAGMFAIQRKVPIKRYVGLTYDYPNTKWNLQFKPQYYLHAAYWHDEFGKRPRSSGCVNMREADAAILFQYIPVGVAVEVIGKTPKGYVGT